MNTATHASIQSLTEGLARATPTRAAVEAVFETTLTQVPGETREELECMVRLSDGSGGAKCTYIPFRDRPVVHLKLDRPVPLAAWDETVRPLGPPGLYVPPAPWTAPGVRGPIAYRDDVYRVGDSTELHLRRNTATDEVTDVLVIWTTTRS